MSDYVAPAAYTIRRYYAGQTVYHSEQSCAGATARDPVSFIKLTRLDLSRCRKCEPPELPAEYALCHDCGWESPVNECERDRGVRCTCVASLTRDTSRSRLSSGCYGDETG